MTDPLVIEITPEIAAWKRGEKRFARGEDAPPRPADNDPCTSPEALEWIGWMAARMRVAMKRRRTLELLGLDRTHD